MPPIFFPRPAFSCFFSSLSPLLQSTPFLLWAIRLLRAETLALSITRTNHSYCPCIQVHRHIYWHTMYSFFCIQWTTTLFQQIYLTYLSYFILINCLEFINAYRIWCPIPKKAKKNSDTPIFPPSYTHRTPWKLAFIKITFLFSFIIAKLLWCSTLGCLLLAKTISCVFDIHVFFRELSVYMCNRNLFANNSFVNS